MALYMESLEDRGMNQRDNKTTQNLATLQLVTLQLLLQNFPGAQFLIDPGWQACDCNLTVLWLWWWAQSMSLAQLLAWQ